MLVALNSTMTMQSELVPVVWKYGSELWLGTPTVRTFILLKWKNVGWLEKSASSIFSPIRSAEDRCLP